MEGDLTFLGLVVMENKLKIETTPIIEQLNDANIKTIMVTGMSKVIFVIFVIFFSAGFFYEAGRLHINTLRNYWKDQTLN